jgi:hypothetical protein
MSPRVCYPSEKKDNAGVKLGRNIMVAIGRELRTMHADVVAEGVPEQFSEILHRLDEASDAAIVSAAEEFKQDPRS